MDIVSYQHIPGIMSNLKLTPQKKNKEFIELSKKFLDFILGKNETAPFPVPDHLKGKIGWYIDVGWYMGGDINSFGIDWISDITDKTYLYESLQFVIDHLLVPFEYVLSGDLYVEGEDFENNIQYIHVSKNKLFQRSLNHEEINKYFDYAYEDDPTSKILVSTKATCINLQKIDISHCLAEEFQEKGFFALLKNEKENDFLFNFCIIEKDISENYKEKSFVLAQGHRGKPPFAYAKTIPQYVVCVFLLLNDESFQKLFKTDNILYIRIRRGFSYQYGQSYILKLQDMASILSVVASWESQPPILNITGFDAVQLFNQCVSKKYQSCVDELFKFLDTKADFPEGPLEDMLEVQKLLKVARDAIYFNPQRASSPLSSTASKMGGQPLTTGFDTWPICDICLKPLHFVLQIFKKEFQQFYFPENTDVFFLFRCANNDCAEYYKNLEQYDTKLFWFYQNASGVLNKEKIVQPKISGKFDKEVRECFLDPFERREYSSEGCHSDDLHSDDLHEFKEKYSAQTVDMFDEKYGIISGTKIGGYPSWVQGPVDPIQCSCGRIKEYFFQLSGEEPNRSEYGTPNSEFKYSDHGLVLVDIGKIYFFVCKFCGPHTIETRIQFS